MPSVELWLLSLFPGTLTVLSGSCKRLCLGAPGGRLYLVLSALVPQSTSSKGTLAKGDLPFYLLL